mgnify:CR=1 FL=1
MIITEAQFEAYQTKIVDRWEAYQALPAGYIVVSDTDPRVAADTWLGIWVGTDANPNTMYLGIETDGYTHS